MQTSKVKRCYKLIKIKLRLAKSTKAKSLKLGIDKQDPNLWLVQGSSGQYEVTYDKETDSFVCYVADGSKNLCKGWKFCQGAGTEKQCKHILAVVLKSDEFELQEDIEENKEEAEKKTEKPDPEKIREEIILSKNQKF